MCNQSSQWLNKKKESMPFAIPMIWREPAGTFLWLPQLQKECQKRRNGQWCIHQLCTLYLMKKNCRFLCHQNLTLWARMMIIIMTRIQLALSHQCQLAPDFELPHSSPEPHLISQSLLDNLVRDLELPKGKAEMLGSRLQQWNF